MKIDEVDKRILNILAENSRLSSREISKKAEISPVTVINRISRMESEGIIKGYSAIIDYDKIGMGYQVMVYLKTAKGEGNDLRDHISKHPCISAVYRSTGEYNHIVLARFFDKQDLNNFVRKLEKHPEVDAISSELIMETIREEAGRL